MRSDCLIHTSVEEGERSPALAPALLETLARIDACTLANAIETFHTRLRNEGFINQTVRCLCPRLEPMVGYAATLTIRGSAPPTASSPYPDRTDWWDYLLTVPKPRVLVVKDLATRPGLGSLVGAVHLNILQALHCIGVVTDGSVRDLAAAEQAGFHFFATGVAVSHAYVHIVGFGQPVEIGGLNIQSGDLLHGDAHGVQSIPFDIAAEIPRVAARVAAREKAIIALCRSPEFSLEKLRDAVKEAQA